MEPQTEKRALFVKEFCQRYGVSESKFYLLLQRKELTAKKNGARTVVDRDEAERWFKALPTVAA